MSIVRDDCNERQMRVDQMIDQFRKAQTRRLAKVTAVEGEVQALESRHDADGQAAVATSTATTRTSHGK